METKRSYTAPAGTVISKVEQSEDCKSLIVIFEEEKPKFKKGDVLHYKGVYECICILDEEYAGITYHSVYYFLSTGRLDYNGYFNNNIQHRYATEEEKQLLLNKMHESGKDYDFEKNEVVDYVWKPEAGETYYIVASNQLAVVYYRWDNDSTDLEFLKNNRIFKTRELAEIALQKQIELFKTLKHY